MVQSASPVITALSRHVFRLTRRNVSSTSAGNGTISVLGIGNPLLDFTVSEDHGLMRRYGITKNTISQVGPAHRNIFHEIVEKPHEPIITLGGATQNSVRIAQWTLGNEGKTAFFGSIANDAQGMLMKKLGEESAVHAIYRIREGVRTGALLSLNRPKDASMIVDYGTASGFKVDVARDPEVKPLILNSQVIYMGAYLWLASHATATSIAKVANERGTPLAMDLQSTKFCPHFASTQYDVLKHIDILLGNAAEALALAKWLARSTFSFANEFSIFLKEPTVTTEILVDIAKRLVNLPREGTSKQRYVVFTHGELPIVYGDSSMADTISSLLPNNVDPKKIEDPRGRGDAFVGGFLARVSQDADVKSACEAGMVASENVLQSRACNPKAADM